MANKSLLILITILGLTISSCSGSESTSEKIDKAAGKVTPTIQIDAKAEGRKETEAEEANQEQDPLAEAIDDAASLKREQNTAGLIASTNPEVRVRNSIRGRQDPFSIVTIKPKIEVLPEKDAASVKPGDRRPSNANNSNNKPPIRRPNNITSAPTINTPPPPTRIPNTKLAEQVLITGLVELGDRIKLIVQAPGEATSRYVDIGQYISNGQVLIKRIESSFPTPMVILEQNGVEISRTVGEAVEDSSNNDSDDQAILPPPPSEGASASWLSNYWSQEKNNSVER